MTLTTVFGGANNESAVDLLEVEPLGSGIGRVVCLKCDGKPDDYHSLVPQAVGVTRCLNCKGLGYVLVDMSPVLACRITRQP
jgi:hypothetical protein